LETEVLFHHGKLVTGVHSDGSGGSLVEMDVRRAPWRKILRLPRGTQVHWADVRTLDIRELSAIRSKIRYRLTYGDGWYVGESGERRYFALQKHLTGIDLARECTTVALRASVLLAVMGGVGLRCVCWLMGMLFHFELSKSSLDRWVKECAAQLPDAAGMAKRLHADKAITEANFDEIFAIGQRPKRCTVVLRDEHGRIFAAKEMEERTDEAVKVFLTELKSWGIAPRVFYVDGCEAYRNAIREVFPNAAIQYDYFHVIQNIWKKLWKAVVARRKELKARGESVETPAYSKKLLGLAQRIWEHRWLFLKRDKNMTEEERTELLALMEADTTLTKVRGFALAVWALFEKSNDEAAAREALLLLASRPEVLPGSVFQKAVTFLRGRFDDMVAFMIHSRVRRNSLAETGIRCLRRLERGHDGFRGAAGLDCYLRLYQAVKYCGWTVHRQMPGLGLPEES
jgi:transposase-like protein